MDLNKAPNDGADSGVDSTRLALKEIRADFEQEAKSVYLASSTPRDPRVDAYLFFSFDLVGSTALKSAQRKNEFKNFTWLDVVRHFYHTCRQSIIKDFGFTQAKVWKYIGDEILFYLKITQKDQIERAVSAIFRTLDNYLKQLSQTDFDIASQYISIKAVAWLSPVREYVNNLSPEQANSQQGLISRLNGDDQLIETYDPEGNGLPPDFLGPNIDAGFRIAAFARRRQLVVSPSLAYYLSQKSRRNDLRIIGFDELKGVANGTLFPAIWYNENWESLETDFDYQERHRDKLVRSACNKEHYSIDILEFKVKPAFKAHGYFFEVELIEEIISQTELAC